jgi:hypothetical protein
MKELKRNELRKTLDFVHNFSKKIKETKKENNLFISSSKYQSLAKK